MKVAMGPLQKCKLRPFSQEDNVCQEDNGAS